MNGTSLRPGTALAPPGLASINLYELVLLQDSHGAEVVEHIHSSPIIDIIRRWQELTGAPIPLRVLRREAKRVLVNCPHPTVYDRELASCDVDDEIVDELANPLLGLRVVRLKRRARSR